MRKQTIRRGDTIRVGPLRIEVSANRDGQCEIHTIYATSHLGRDYVDEAVLIELQAEAGNWCDVSHWPVYGPDPDEPQRRMTSRPVLELERPA